MTSPFSLYSPVWGWWPLEATGHLGRSVRSPAGWRVASGGCWSVLKKSYLCRSPDRMTSDRDSRKHTCSHSSSSSFRSPSLLPFIFLHLSIPPLHLPAAFILFLLIIMICIQQKRLIQAGIRLPAQAGRWACVLGGFWVVWLLRTYNNKDYERLITEIWKTQIEVMWLLRLCVCVWWHDHTFACLLGVCVAWNREHDDYFLKDLLCVYASSCILDIWAVKMRRNRRRRRARSGRDAAEKARGRCYIRPVKAALCVCSVGTNLSTRARWISHPSVVRALRGRSVWPGKERRFRRGDLCCCLG